jgi:hypothetical protein
MTRHVRSWAIAALAVFALAGAAAPSFAGITYNVTNYAAGQNGWSLAGTITTSRTGAITSASDITDWDLIASKLGVNRQYSMLTSTNSTKLFFSGTLNATPTTLSLATGSSFTVSQEPTNTSRINWDNQFNSGMGTVSGYGASWLAVGTMWSNFSAPYFSPIVDGAWTLGTRSAPSAVPEIDPATGGSALSLVAGVLAMIEQRRRRAALVA